MEILLGAFAALGVLVFLGSLTILLLSPLFCRGMVTVWHICGECEELEFRVRCCVLLQKFGLVSARLLLVDAGLTVPARKRAEAFARELPGVDLITYGDLETYFDFTKAE